MVRSLQAASQALSLAKSEEDFQAIGVLCRETVISLAQSVYVSGTHVHPDNVIPSSTDAARMLEAYLATELRGRESEELRAYAKSCLKLSVALQHTRTATMRDAALTLEATSALASLVGILASRTDSWFADTRARDRKSAELEFMAVLLATTFEEHPVFKGRGMKFKSLHFADMSISLNVSADGVAATAVLEQPRWWAPATRDNAARITDELVMRALAMFPAIERFEW
jgi:hypothetical protein